MHILSSNINDHYIVMYNFCEKAIKFYEFF